MSNSSDLDTSTITIAQPISIELTLARALSITIEACDKGVYETPFQARLLARRKVSLYGEMVRKGPVRTCNSSIKQRQLKIAARPPAATPSWPLPLYCNYMQVEPNSTKTVNPTPKVRP
jgi:hypothetical protein